MPAKPQNLGWLVTIALAAAAALAGSSVATFKAGAAYDLSRQDHDAVIRVLEILPRVERALSDLQHERKGGK